MATGKFEGREEKVAGYIKPRIPEPNCPEQPGAQKTRFLTAKVLWRIPIGFKGMIFVRLVNNSDKCPIMMKAAEYEIK